MRTRKSCVVPSSPVLFSPCAEPREGDLTTSMGLDSPTGGAERRLMSTVSRAVRIADLKRIRFVSSVRILYVNLSPTVSANPTKRPGFSWVSEGKEAWKYYPIARLYRSRLAPKTQIGTTRKYPEIGPIKDCGVFQSSDSTLETLRTKTT